MRNLRKRLIVAVLFAVLVGVVMGAPAKTLENHDKAGSNELVRITEHRISTLELEELKREQGVSEEGVNYNVMIDGHGTGLRPPTDSEWEEIADKAYVIESIAFSEPAEAPSSVDHTTKPWFPPIGTQGEEGSCVAWAVGYYVKTFQEAKEHGWDLSGAIWMGGDTGYPTAAYQDRIISPDFVYHLINGGEDSGASFYDGITLVCAIGASSWMTMPNDAPDSTSWPSEEAWREAPLYRGNSSGFEYLELSTDADIVSLKNWIAADNLAVIGVDAYQFINLTSRDLWTVDNYQNPVVNHANTIVGYDDNFAYREEGVSRHGAFKIANSWLEGGWEWYPDGCYWISYKAMKERVGYCMFYRDRIVYDPKLLALFGVDHSRRGECDILIGMGNHSAPVAAKSFSDYIKGGNHPFCANNVTLDVTEFGSAVPSVLNEPFFIQVADRGPLSAHSGTHYWCPTGSVSSWFRMYHAFDIPETGATLNFWSYYEIEEDWDYGYVEVHDLDTGQWYTLPGLATVSTLPNPQDNPSCPAAYEPSAYYAAGRWNAFTGSSNVLYEEEMSLAAFAGHTIELYFTYWTDAYVLGTGWCVDDVGLPEIGFFDDVESGLDGWTSVNGWYIGTSEGVTRVNGTLLSFSIEHYQNYSAGSLRAVSTSQDVPVATVDLNCVLAFTIVGDVNGDHNVDYDDLVIVAEAYGSSGGSVYEPDADFERDGDVDCRDLAIFGRNYGKSSV